MDKFSKKKRGEIMSKIRSSNTKFEQLFLSKLRKRTKQKFKTNVKEIKGKPDIVFVRKNLCVFLDSDFWHGWRYPRWKRLMKNDFWQEKIENNRKRDRKTTAYLRKEKWTVLRFWEHQIKKNPEKAIDKIQNAL
jgi:DNA mismatch endonuclease (patch repair protein)